MEAVMITEHIQAETERTDDARLIDRRRMLTAFAATAAGVVGAMALPGAAVASTGDVVHAGQVANGSATDAGLVGQNPNRGGGVGVYGAGISGDGVVGYSEGVNKSGVWGKDIASGGAGITGDGTLAGVVGRTPSADGFGVIAEGGVGSALKVSGKAVFTRSGIAAFPKKKNYILITVPGGLTTGVSRIIATMQGSPGSNTWIAYACRNSASTIKVRLNKKSSKSTTVAWMVFD
jgi:hypothetical protein